ncbi:MAG: AAA family ATPase [Gemmataceae bacterium]
MIPKRIKLQGFLCYKDEQEIAFDGSSLWMLAGLNGSGKSTVFDAVTFALFGHHRGGSQGATDLITKGEPGFAVEFEFTIEGHRYLVRRTLRRKGAGTTASQQILHWADGRWEAVADTHMKKEFDKWVSQHVGLNYETFTSSVLLLQGRAEKLLDSTAKGRAEVLASIVDLERYQKLHERADGRRKEYRGRVEALEGQLKHIAEVSDLELVAATNRIDDAGEALTQAQQEAERLQTLEFQSRQWAETQRKLAAALERRQKAGKTVQEAAAIDKDLARLRELRDVMPHVEAVFLNRTNLTRSQEATKSLSEGVRELDGRLNQREHKLQQQRYSRTNLLKRISEDETKQQDIGRKLLPLSAQLERVKLVEQRRDEAKRLEDELAGLPADFAPRLKEAQRKIDELASLQQALPHLSRLYQIRLDLNSAKDRAAAAAKHEKELTANGEEIRAKLEALRPAADAAKAALQVAQDKLSSERALLHEAMKLRDEFDVLEGSKICRMCGQPLTPGHFHEEKGRRDKAVTAAEARVQDATAAFKAAQSEAQKVGEQFQAVEQAIQAARDEYRDNRHQLQQYERETQRLTDDCGREYDELAPPFRAHVAAAAPGDWLATTFPTSADLDATRNGVQGLAGLRQELEKVREAQARWNGLSTQVAAARQAAADLAATITGDPAAIRRDFTRLEADQKAVAESLRVARQEDRTLQSEIERISEECQRLRESIAEQNGKLGAEEEKRKLCEQAVAGARKALPADWQVQADRVALAEFNRLRSERESLEKAGVEARAEQLKQARIEVETLRQSIADLERERDQFPEEARREPTELQTQFKRARGEVSRCSDELNAARNEKANLQQRREQRAAAAGELKKAELELNRFKLLAELLGRDRLQRHLVRQAERQIVDYANGVLDRLSGGQLMLRLCGADDGTDQALELEAYNRSTGQDPINVAFLSGSQRFRVAVSLALGIGQYASRQHRPIESVIIDEGFGCLDRQGRQVMIQELHNLRGHLHCILLVSHQEEFAEAFADGYRFELTNGSTKVTRFQR